jgi:hypothetical protein
MIFCPTTDDEWYVPFVAGFASVKNSAHTVVTLIKSAPGCWRRRPKNAAKLPPPEKNSAS